MWMIFSVLIPTASCEVPESYGDEEFIWSTLEELCPTREIAAGIMGYMFRESRLKADAVAGWNVREEGTCEAFVAEVDGGMEKDEFVRRVQDYGGFGLGQWVSHDYVGSLYDYIKEHDCSIADVSAQCAFAAESLLENGLLWSELLECSTAIQCGRRIGLLYDGTSAEGAEAIAGFSDHYWRMMKDD